MRSVRHFIIPALAIALVIYGCKKKGDDTTDPVECTVGNGITNGRLIDNRYIIMYKPASAISAEVSTLSTTRKLSALLKSHELSETAVLSRFSGGIQGFVANINAAKAAELSTDPLIEKVEQDRIVALGTCFEIAAPTLVTWNVKKTGFGDGTGKTAWVIDTGIESTHPDLNVDVNRSRSYVSGDNSIEDLNGHGTHVAGIIGAKNNLIGTLGVASNATLIALKVLNEEGEGNLSYIIQALAYVNANAKAGDVVNISLGEEDASEIFDAQVRQTASLGIFVTIAAGNDGKPASDFSPARANGTNIFTVAAIDSLNNFADFSNYGTDCVDFAAPGKSILSSYTQKRYAYMSGTSQAAPHLAGLLLLNGNNIHIAGYTKNNPDNGVYPIAMK
ncbi:MAG: S8 family serine peptidase [Flavitalea sp.]